jgi:uncharacterized protein involved in exopolysaccharide biosynthesis
LELRDFKTESGLASLEKQRDSLLELIAELRMDLFRSQAQEKALIAGLSERQSKLKEIPEMVLVQEQTGQAQAVGQSLREQLFMLEIEEKQLSSRYPSDHPSVKQIREQIADVRKIKDNEAVTSAKTQGVNPVYNELKTEMLKSQAALAEVQAKIEVVSEDLDQAEDRIASFNDADMKVAKFTREIDMYREVVKTNMELLEQAKIDNELEARRISSLNVMQPPTFVLTPSNPKPMITFGVGGLLSLIAGLGVALLFNKKRQPSVEQVGSVNRGRRQTPAIRSNSPSSPPAREAREREEPVAVGAAADSSLRVPR